MAKTFDGVCVYEILPDGCLNGVYTNDRPDTKNEMFNEIARKVSGNDKDKIIGKYVCCYIDVGNTPKICELVIQVGQRHVRNGQYDFMWYESGVMVYEGTGWRTRDTQITVSYRDC